MLYRYCLRQALFGLLVLLLAMPALGQSAQETLRSDAEQELALILERYPSYAKHIKAELSTEDVTPDALDQRRHFGRGEMAGPFAFSVASVQIWLTSELIDQIWDAEANGGAGDWLNDVRISYSRDAAGTITEQLFEDWDAETGVWVGSLRITYERNSEGQSIETLYEEWDLEANDGAGGWVPLQRFTYAYTGQGNVETLETEFWDDEEGAYFIYSRSTYTYDSSGEFVLQLLTESGLFGPLQPSFRYSYTYDDEGNEIEELVEFFDSGVSEWGNFRFEQRTYDEYGEEIMELIQDWDETANGGDGAWVNSDLTVTEFSPNSEEWVEVVETEQVWDPVADGGAGAWVNTDRYLSEFVASTNTYVDTDQVWDATANAWVGEQRLTYYISDEGALIEFIYEAWDVIGNDWVNVERGTAEFNDEGLTIVQLTEEWENMDWVNYRRTLLSYEEFESTAAENETPGQSFELEGNYPNPFLATTAIHFSIATAEHVTLEVFDVLGRRVATLVDAVKQSGKHEVVLDASSLAGGLYVYRLSSDQRQESRTMLLVR